MNDSTMLTACMSTRWTNHIRDVILDLVNEHGLTYTKLDFSVVTSAYVTDPAISGCYATDHEGHRDHPESFLANYRGLFRLFDELQEKAPDLFIDCTFETQGKLHLIDYAFLKHAEGNWLANMEEASPTGALRVRNLAWSRSPVIPAASCVIGNLRLDSRDLEFDFLSLIGSFPIMLGDARETPAEKRQWLRSWTQWIRQAQEEFDYMSYRQDLPGFGEPAEGHWDGWQRINTETRNGGILGIFRQGAAEAERTATVEGLKSLVSYEVSEAPTGRVLHTMTGEELEQEGFSVSMERPYQGKIFRVRAVD
jgi:alpha-galactosidase